MMVPSCRHGCKDQVARINWNMPRVVESFGRALGWVLSTIQLSTLTLGSTLVSSFNQTLPHSCVALVSNIWHFLVWRWSRFLSSSLSIWNVTRISLSEGGNSVSFSIAPFYWKGQRTGNLCLLRFRYLSPKDPTDAVVSSVWLYHGFTL